jgi:hypothetical protein
MGCYPCDASQGQSVPAYLPHAHARDFSVELDCAAFPELTGPVTSALPGNARIVWLGGRGGLLHLDDEADENGATDLRLIDPGIFAKMAGCAPVCGPFSLRLDVWDLDAIGNSASTADRTTRVALRARSGVSIYRDGFRVMPYGERGDDWLELNQRRVNNPTMRVSNNQIVGLVEITGQHNSDLKDRTSREDSSTHRRSSTSAPSYLPRCPYWNRHASPGGIRTPFYPLLSKSGCGAG